MANALVVSGGGSKGAFAVGVVRHILENTPVNGFSAISGTSTGALMAPLIALGEMNILELIYTSTTTDMIIDKFNIGDRNILGGENHFFGTEPLLRLVKRTYEPRFNDIMALNTPLFFNAVNMQKGTIIAYTTLQDDELIEHINNEFQNKNENRSLVKIRNSDDFIFAIMASSNQPVFMNPINVQPDIPGISQNVDGGAREFIPIRIILELDKAVATLNKANILPSRIDEIYAISNSPLEVQEEPGAFNNLLDMLKRTIHIFQADIAVNDIESIRSIEAGVKFIDKLRNDLSVRHNLSPGQISQLIDVPENPYNGTHPMNLHLFQPKDKLADDGGLEFKPAQMGFMISKGRRVAEEYFNNQQPIRFKT